MPDAEGGALADAVTLLARHALAFGRIDRTACWHPDGSMRESDTDHTVMLGWLAPALASLLYPARLNVGLVAQFALIHDMPEVHAGDTPTLRISAEGLAAKKAREHAAVSLLLGEFADALPWVPLTVAWYERQMAAEARFVRAVDKVLPGIVHLLDGAKGLMEEGVTVAELRVLAEQRTADITAYAGDFPELLALRATVVERMTAVLAEATAAEVA